MESGEYMIELLAGTAITLISLCIGFTLGKHSSIIAPDFKQKINQIFDRVVPSKDVGAIERPSAQQNYYRDNPGKYEEQQIMEQEFDKLQPKP